MTRDRGSFVKSLSVRRRHPLVALALLLVALAVTGGLYAGLAPSKKAQAASSSSIAVDEGRKLFLDGCSSCHGLHAQGTSQGPSLVGVGAAAVDFMVGTGRMPLQQPGVQAAQKPPSYSQSQIDQMAAYIASLAPGPEIPSKAKYDYSDADLVEGGALFRSNCSQCHNFAGQGGALTRGKAAPNLNTTSAKHMYEAMLTGPGPMPVFGDKSMTPEKKRDIIKFVHSLREEPNPGGDGLGRIGPVSEGLVAWIAGIGGIALATVWITARAK